LSGQTCWPRGRSAPLARGLAWCKLFDAGEWQARKKARRRAWVPA
jgi:hypothetical protein